MYWNNTTNWHSGILFGLRYLQSAIPCQANADTSQMDTAGIMGHLINSMQHLFLPSRNTWMASLPLDTTDVWLSTDNTYYVTTYLLIVCLKKEGRSITEGPFF